MFQTTRKSIAVFALVAGTMLPAAAETMAANRIVEVFNPAVVGSSVDYGQMGYVDDDGNFISVAGEKILGAWVEFTFIPETRLDAERFTAQMAVPVLPDSPRPDAIRVLRMVRLSSPSARDGHDPRASL